MAMVSDARAFLGKRVTVDTELLLAYADVKGVDPFEVARWYNAKLTLDRTTCKMTWVSRQLSWQCSACGRMTRGFDKARPNFCPVCGAIAES